MLQGLFLIKKVQNYSIVLRYTFCNNHNIYFIKSQQVATLSFIPVGNHQAIDTKIHKPRLIYFLPFFYCGLYHRAAPYLAGVLGVPEHPRNLGVHNRGLISAYQSLAITKGQIILKGLFGVLEFSQKTNERTNLFLLLRRIRSLVVF